MANTVPYPIVILVQDWSNGTATAVTYVCGDNVLDFLPIYKTIKELNKHPERGKISRNASTRSIHLLECGDEFLDIYWRSMSNVLEYAVDFLPHDTPAMQKIWMHLLDTLQLIAASLPHTLSNDRRTNCEHTYTFTQIYAKTVDLMNDVLNHGELSTTSVVVHQDHGERMSEPGLRAFNTGPFRAGLKAWQQFLHNRSPGFRVPPAERQYVEKYIDVPGKVCQRQVPMGALAIVQKHTEKMRELAHEHADTIDNENERQDFLHEFESNTVTLNRPSTYTSMTGHPTTLQPFHPKPGPYSPWQRVDLPIDPDPLEPSLVAMETLAADLRGHEAPEHPLGDDKFQMMTVTSTAVEKEAFDSDVMMNGTGTATKPIAEKKALDDMFNGWTEFGDPKRVALGFWG